MRLPHLLLESQFFSFDNEDELLAALGNSIEESEKAEVVWLSALGLPPVTSRDVLATMLGINPALIWSFEYRPLTHYRSFTIPKGARKERVILAPRVALKVVQKWLSVQLQSGYTPPDHVFGFVPGRSHIDAAKVHRLAKWTYSVDISNFFPTTPQSLIQSVMDSLGYGAKAAEILARICCFQGFLPQGAPSSPVLSNLAFRRVDAGLQEVARKFGVRLSRYADDVVFSGTEDFPEALAGEVRELFVGTPWTLSPDKTEFSSLPARLKVHGLLVHGEEVRLTKGYRNKLRAYAHLMAKGKVRDDDKKKIAGHLQYERHVLNSVD